MLNTQILSGDEKLGRLLLGISLQPELAKIQPQNFIVVGLEVTDTHINIGYKVGERNQDNTEKETRLFYQTIPEFQEQVNIICSYLGFKEEYIFGANDDTNEKIYKFFDGKYRTEEWITQKIAFIRKTRNNILKSDMTSSSISIAPSNLAKTEIKQIKNQYRLETLHNYHKGMCHYMKYVLKNSDGTPSTKSVRFFFQFQDRPHFEGKFVMKDHATKNYIEITNSLAIDIIAGKDVIDQYRVISFMDGKKYSSIKYGGYFKDGVRVIQDERTLDFDLERDQRHKVRRKEK